MAEALSIDFLRRDGGTQPRAALDPATVANYAEAIRSGAAFPPVIVFYDGTDHWLADGFHRVAAHEEAEFEEILADIRPGTRREAVLFACGANAAHGLPRSNEDKRRAALLLLGDPEWTQWSDREIARRCAVSDRFINSLRATLTANGSQSERTYVTRHGSVAKMDTAAIGKHAQAVATIRSMPVDALYQVVSERHRERQDLKRVRRDEREVALAERIADGNAALAEAGAAGKRYGVLLADPEWRYEPWSRDTGMDRAADNHYPTTPTSEIRKRPVAEIAADDAVLFLWATVPMLPDAFAVIADWGFSYKSHFIWVKRRSGEARGPGYWNTNEHELLLVATRGNPPAPAPGTQWPSVVIAPVGRHSEKPERIYELIEAYFPTLPKIELNARARRPGWEVWGAEAPDQLPDAGKTVHHGRPTAAEIDVYEAEMATVDLPALPIRGQA
ncbi:MT-A70 family methyltransferase [Bosea sp. (in: a-proteobacteria)]|uniref:MT-A70 family methyltransferase n=1 Tax=Bosea sp. (in: a-proteobacteria) TaxID=1871050 RepID=UPI003B3AE5F3